MRLDIDKVNEDIKELRAVQSEWNRTKMDTISANDLISKIGSFIYTKEARFNYSDKFYQYNAGGPILVEDAISDLENYSQSKTKIKRNRYFIKAMRDLNMSIEFMIDRLKLLQK